MDNFTWLPFFEELLNVICNKYDKHSLAEQAHKIFEGYKGLEDKDREGNIFPLKEIDPLTFIALFHKNHTVDKKLLFCEKAKEIFNLSSEVPRDINGIPAFYYSNAWFFGYVADRDENLINMLWDFAKDLNNNSLNEVLFKVIINTKGNKVGKLSQFIFICKPEQYYPCDSRTLKYLFNSENVENSIEFFYKVQEIGKQRGQKPYELSYKAVLEAPINPLEELREELLQYGESLGAKRVIVDNNYTKLEIFDGNRRRSAVEVNNIRKNNFKIYASEKYLDSELKKFVEIKRTTTHNAEFTIYSEDKMEIAKAIVKSAITSNGQVNQYYTQETNKEKNMLKKIPLNQILYGPPGTGKTYTTAIEALKVVMPEEELAGLNLKDREAVMAKYNEYKAKGQIKFITFHQSYSYEEFVEGIKPVLDDSCKELKFERKDGILKQIADLAETEYLKTDKEFDFNPSTNSAYKISLGDATKEEDSDIYKYCMENNKIALGYGLDVDFSQASNKAEIKRIFEENDSFKDESKFTIEALERFKNKIRQNDLIFVSKGNKFIRAIGKVLDDDYFCKPDSEIRYSQFRNVEWILKDVEIPVEKLYLNNFIHSPIYAIYNNQIIYENLKALIGNKNKTQIKNYVLIIDEINRGNISKIFGEFITLFEEDKRLGQENALTVKLPYSQKEFGVPKNLYIIGTMNTADRSIALLDIALRRRFEFIPKYPDSSIIKNNCPETVINGINLCNFLDAINERIEVLYDKDHAIGHSYLMGLSDYPGFLKAFNNRILPLLQEYFYNDYEKIAKVLNQEDFEENEKAIIHKNEVMGIPKFSINPKLWDGDKFPPDAFIRASLNNE